MSKTRVIAFIVLFAALLVANFYLMREKMLFYATGTKEEAFLKSTWLMSEQEIERANHTRLRPVEPEMVLDPSNSIWQTYKIKMDSGVTVYGQRAIINYFFKEEKLFALIIDFRIPRGDLSIHDLDSLVVVNISKECGTPSESKVEVSNSLYTWNSQRRQIIYASGQRDYISAYVRILYEPLKTSWDSIRGKFPYTLYSRPPTFE